MSLRKIIITREDYNHLQKIVSGEITAIVAAGTNLAALKTELDQAEIVDSDCVPDDVITMNSTVQLRDPQTDEVDTYTLVYPKDADIAQDKLSILTPIGTAILGYRTGDEIKWRVPKGTRKVVVDNVLYQPERIVES